MMNRENGERKDLTIWTRPEPRLLFAAVYQKREHTMIETHELVVPKSIPITSPASEDAKDRRPTVLDRTL
jgi:hypothetical protein